MRAGRRRGGRAAALRLGASLLLTGLPFVAAWLWLEPRQVVGHLKRWDAVPLALAFVAYLLRSVLGGLRLRALCAPEARVAHASAVHALGATLRNLIPFGLGEAAYVALLRRHLTPRVGDALAAALILRVLDLATTTALLTLALPWLAPLAPTAVLVAWGAMSAVSLGLLLLLRAGGGPALARLGGAPEQAAPGRLARGLSDLRTRLHAFRRDPQRLRVLALSFAMQAAMLGVFVATCHAASDVLGLRAALFVGFLLWPFSMLPIKGVLDFGTHETAWTLLLALLGLEMEQAAAIALSTHLVLLGLTLAVGALAALWLLRPTPHRPLSARRLCGSPAVALATLAFLVALLPGLLAGHVPAPLHLLALHPPWRELAVWLPEVPSYVLSDQIDYYLPLLVHLREALAAGVLPFWSDALQLGAPFLAVARSEAPVAPLALGSALLGTPTAYTLYVVARTLLGAVFFQRWMRTLGVGAGVAMLGALVFSFNSYPVQRLGVGFHLAYVLLPGALLGVEGVMAGRRAWQLGLPWLLAGLVASGYPPVTAFCAVVIAAWSLFRLASSPPPQRGRALLRLGLAAALGAALALPLLLGTFEFAALAETGYRADYASLTLEPRQVLTLLLPFWFGEPGRDAGWIEQATYLGVLPLLAILPAFALGRRRPERRMLAGLVLAIAVVAWGVGGFDRYVYAHLPFFAGTKPRTWIAVGMFALSALACLALDDLRDTRGVSRGRRLTATTLLLGVPLALLGLAHALRPGEVEAAWLERELLRQGLWVLLAGGLLWGAVWRPPLPRWGLAAALALVAVDLWAMGSGWNRTAPHEAFYPATPGTEWLRARQGHGRILALGEALPGYTPLAVGLRPLAGRGFADAPTRRLYRLLSPDAFAGSPTYHRFAACDTRLTAPVLDLLAVRYVVTPPETRPIDLACQVLAWRRELRLEPGDTLHLDLAPQAGAPPERLDLALVPGARAGGRVRVARAGWSQPPLRRPVPREAERLGFSIPLRRLALAAGEASTLEVVFEGDGEPEEEGAQALALRWIKVVARTPLEALHRELPRVYDGEIRVWENRGAFRRAFLVPRVVTASPDAAFAAMARGERALDQWAWIAGSPREPHPLARHNDRPLRGRVEILETRWGRQRFRVQSSREALLVVSDRLAPGWSVSIDGRPAPALRVDGALRGVAVPAGSSRVEWRYAPRGLWLALAVAALAAAALALAALVSLAGGLLFARGGPASRAGERTPGRDGS